MSLDVYLFRKKWVSYDEGKTHTVENEEVYSANITHNLGRMAQACDIYKTLWHPETIGAVYAKDIIPLLEKGLTELKEKPEHFQKYDAPNKWGMYKHFVPFVEKYLNACKENPDAVIDVSI